jgi:TPR repeat protein
MWLRMAAIKDHPSAQFLLAYCYDTGLGVPKDHKVAAAWYHRSAVRGHMTSQHNLGIFYAKGMGVPKNYVLAYMWFNVAASSGSQDSISARDSIAKKMTRIQIERAQSLSHNH